MTKDDVKEMLDKAGFAAECQADQERANKLVREWAPLMEACIGKTMEGEKLTFAFGVYRILSAMIVFEVFGGFDSLQQMDEEKTAELLNAIQACNQSDLPKVVELIRSKGRES